LLDKYSIDFKNDRTGVKKLDVIDYFEKHEIQFISANESIVTSTPFGKAMLGIIGVIAELEIETTKA
jgi:site-specific DNA recombinase